MSKNTEPAQNAEIAGRLADGEEYEKLLTAARGAADRKAIDMVALDIRKIASFALLWDRKTNWSPTWRLACRGAVSGSVRSEPC